MVEAEEDLAGVVAARVVLNKVLDPGVAVRQRVVCERLESDRVEAGRRDPVAVERVANVAARARRLARVVNGS